MRGYWLVNVVVFAVFNLKITVVHPPNMGSVTAALKS